MTALDQLKIILPINNEYFWIVWDLKYKIPSVLYEFVKLKLHDVLIFNHGEKEGSITKLSIQAFHMFCSVLFGFVRFCSILFYCVVLCCIVFCLTNCMFNNF